MKGVILVILDGFGYSKNKKGNATLNQTPYLDKLRKEYSFTTLSASGKAVGLPPNYMGNSEVGHLNLGAGRDLKQVITRINGSIKDGSFYKNKVLLKTIRKAQKSSLHLIGLCSEAGVHSHLSHLQALIDLAKKNKVKTYLHVIADGRDTAPKEVNKYLKKIKGVNLATVSGRYYAMDRDERWLRTKLYYNCLLGKGKKVESMEDVIKESYKKKITDEFIIPTIINGFSGIKKGEQVILFNFREDRMRQITKLLKKFHPVCMYPYFEKNRFSVLFDRVIYKNTLSEVVSKAGLKQLKLAETEKYAHVTYFFNGGQEKKFRNEKRIIIDSPKVATYDQRPEMSAYQITNFLEKELGKKQLVVVNYANCDMVGHTGNIKATRKSIKTVDDCLKKIVPLAMEKNYYVLITADHGNCEKMVGEWKKSHTLSQVPFYLVGKKTKLKKGSLKNVAPTILNLLKIKKPKEISATSLI